MQRRAATLVDALQEAQRPEADRAVRKRMAEVLDDVERDRNMEPGQDPCRALRVHARHDGVELAVHEVNARLDRRAAPGPGGREGGRRGPPAPGCPGAAPPP